MIEAELSPEEFYEATLAREGLSRGDENAYFQKIAEELEMTLEEAKLAVAYYEQLARDEELSGQTWFESSIDRQNDAVKMAKAFMAHNDKAVKSAEAAADRLLEKLATAALDWAQDVGIEDVDPLELVQAAGKQAETAVAWLAEERKLAEEKTAELHGLEIPAPSKEAAEGEPIQPPPAGPQQPAFPGPASLYGASERGPHTLRMHEAEPALGHALASTNPALGAIQPEEATANYRRMTGQLGYKTPEQHAAFTHNVLEHMIQNEGVHPVAAMQAIHKTPPVPQTGGMDAVKGFVGRNKGRIAGGAALAAGLGLGARHLMKKRREAKQRQALEAVNREGEEHAVQPAD